MLLNEGPKTDQPGESSFHKVHQADGNKNHGKGKSGSQPTASTPLVAKKGIDFGKITFRGSIEAIVRAFLNYNGSIRFQIVFEDHHPELQTQAGSTVRVGKSMAIEAGWHELFDFYKVRVSLPQSLPKIKYNLMVLNEKISSPYVSPLMPSDSFFSGLFFEGIEAWRAKNRGCLHLATTSGILVGAIGCQIHKGQELCIEAWLTALNAVYLSIRPFNGKGETHQGPYYKCVESLFRGARPIYNRFQNFRKYAPEALPESKPIGSRIFAQWVRIAVEK
ncbi:MAG: hypothetical protein LQ351_007975 [Letrouitia transgressa]|nr:MAG: hypothetical protein LQ351_007975 [Letrouitia transgressa]